LEISRYERSECSLSTKDKRFSELSLSSVTGLFYIFLFGIILSCVIAFTEFLMTAKAESEKLDVDFREILRIKMIEYVILAVVNTNGFSIFVKFIIGIWLVLQSMHKDNLNLAEPKMNVMILAPMKKRK
jgi:hypothetical protein